MGRQCLAKAEEHFMGVNNTKNTKVLPKPHDPQSSADLRFLYRTLAYMLYYG